MTSKEWYNKWAEKFVVRTLWIHKGPKNTPISEMRCVVLDSDENTAIITIYNGDNGFSVYRADK